MALKTDRMIDATEIGYYLNGTASKGVVVSVSTAGSGVGLDLSQNVCGVAATPSGNRPLGVLLQDVVVVDLTKFPVNWHKDQAASGDKVTILTKGWVVTDQVTGNAQAGQIAVLHNTGTVSGINADELDNPLYSNANPVVGRFRTNVDENGYARLYIEL